MKGTGEKRLMSQILFSDKNVFEVWKTHRYIIPTRMYIFRVFSMPYLRLFTLFSINYVPKLLDIIDAEQTFLNYY